MGTKGILDQIVQELKNGASRDELNRNYNKGTVTKAIKRYEQEKSEENELQQLIKSIFNLIDKKSEYEIKINISKKVVPRNVVSKKIEDEPKIVQNPFELYSELGAEKYLSKLKCSHREELIEIIKKYFNMRKKNYDTITVEELSKYIITKTEKIMNIGNCFK